MTLVGDQDQQVSHVSLNRERHAAAMARREFQCPNCAYGWLKYFVQDDSQQCVLCGYSGGESHAGPGVVEIQVPVAEWLKGSPSRDVMQQIVKDMLPLSTDVTHVKVRLSLCLIPQPGTTR